MALDSFSFSVIGIFAWLVGSVAGIAYGLIKYFGFGHHEIDIYITLGSAVSLIIAYFVMGRFVRYEN